ncbi:MAG: GNAT family N-acetyltransferase [Candidatus Abyssobacteria bacterium SURF_5]|uniref:GNAT family N-acetyltransferase n=1 Tax=Abyssobacteria bacterium (strain SURF_5) TaxID=2093360 RepID=A0A3A4NTW1_ABYX5|nr:MAG: GNAT family N-acetyltransferase [Candidatus Abyssubacteria bacterium SURF_5]
MIIRLAEQDDLQQCRELDAIVSGLHSRKQFLEQRIRHRRAYLSIEEARVVGLITFQTNFIDCLYISLIIVHPDFRRRGIARKLINQVAGHSRNGKLFSSTEADNEQSIKMHEALGFQFSGYIDNLPQGKREILFCKNVARSSGPIPLP